MESSSSQNFRPSPEDDLVVHSPVLRLVLVSDKGMVFESSTSFAVGCNIELAVHVQNQAKSKRQTAHTTKSEFITSEGIVVSCAPHTVVADKPVYEVTMLFSSVRSRDRRKLRHLANRCRQPLAGNPMEERPETLCDVMGLN